MGIIVRILYWALSLRYTISVKGLEHLNKKTARVIMPSHIALVDPLIIWALLSKRAVIHPVMTKLYYSNVFLHPLFRMMQAVPVEEFDRDKGSLEDATRMMNQVSKSLNEGKNILLYPQGELARQGYQSIIGKKSAFYACSHAPKSTSFLAVTIRGLRGSRSSYAWNGKAPRLFGFFCKGLLFGLLNLLFFIPKRKIEIVITDQTKHLQQALPGGLDLFNIALEKIYNANGEEPFQYISGLSRYNTVRHHPIPTKIEGALDSFRKKVDYSTIKYPKDIFRSIEEKIRAIKPDYMGEVTLETSFVLDCYFDSLDMAELKTSVAASFPNASNPPLLDLKVVGDVVLMAMGKSPFVEELKPCQWNFMEDDHLVRDSATQYITEDATILTCFKRAFKKLKNQSKCYDQIFGVQSAGDFLIKVYLVANILKKYPEKHIAIMLPSLSATSLLIMACYFAKKIPVMLNWTLSEEAFAHCVASQEVPIILTSRTFFKKVQTPWLQKYPMTFFEDLLKDLSLSQKLKALFQSKIFSLPKKLDDIAVVLFTSGSEALPKAVTLTHQNILQDLKGAAGILDLRNDEILLAFLPPFHSFGFSINTVLPLISSVRVVYSPDPTDASTLNNLVQHTKLTLITSTPTFFKGMCSSADNSQLSSLRLVVVGAEKCPEALFDLMEVKVPKVTLLEGYGITECSPIISANPYSPGKKIKRGSVGLPIIGTTIKILDIETQEEKSVGEEGMIYVASLSVFEGYIDASLESPFFDYKGKRYYKTGDLGYLDDDGYLYISGRLKRFVKIAGEMISLPAVEAVLLQKYGKEDEVAMALEAKEYQDGSVKFVIFSIVPLDVVDINTYLRKQGVSNFVKVSEMVLLDSIPLLGTGKTDYTQLKKMIV